jgi:hypothetical protein
MTESKVKYTEEEILEIFKEQHRLCSPLDPEADPWAEITAKMANNIKIGALWQKEKILSFHHADFLTDYIPRRFIPDKINPLLEGGSIDLQCFF